MWVLGAKRVSSTMVESTADASLQPLSLGFFVEPEPLTLLQMPIKPQGSLWSTHIAYLARI